MNTVEMNWINSKDPGPLKALTPAEEYQKKEKVLYIKFAVLFLIMNSFYALLIFTPKEVVIEQGPLAQKGHSLVEVNARLLTPLPPKGEKTAVSLVFQKNILIRNGFLWRRTEEEKYLLEIPSNQVSSLINLNSEALSISPPITDLQKRKVKQGQIHEINF
jgi:hypothetical protein